MKIISASLSKFFVAFLIVALVTAALPVPTAMAADTGWNSPTGCTSGGTAWTNPNNAVSSNNQYTQSNAGNEILVCSFNLPAIPGGNTIAGIEVSIEGSSSGSREANVSLSWNGGTTYTASDGTSFTSSENTFILGDTGEDWGRTWAVGDFTSGNFRVRLVSTSGFFVNGTISLDHVQVRVTYGTSSTITASAGAGGSINPAGAVIVGFGANQAFDSTPNTGFVLADVLVDGGSVGRANDYTFNSVTANHTIASSFDGGWSQPSSNVNSGWANSANGYVSDNSRATANATTDIVNYCGFNLSIPPNQTVDGIEVAVEGFATGSREAVVSLSWDGGTSHTSSSNTSIPNGGSEATYILGGAGDDWGRSWTDTDLSNANFCVELDATLATGDLNIDQVQVRVTYHPAVFYTITASAGPGGTITPSGAVSVQDTSDQAFDSTPNATFILADVLVDGSSIGRTHAYTFTNVLADHAIAASFNGGWAAPSANSTTGAWINIGNIYTSDNNLANVIIIGTADLSGFNFVPAIPAAASIEGIEVAIEAAAVGPSEINVSLSWNGGTNFTTAQSTSFTNDGPETTQVLGGPANTWGRTWTGSEFGSLVIRLDSPPALGAINIDQVQIKVYYDDIPPDTTITVAPSDPSNIDTPTFEFTGTDDVDGSGVASFECQVDGGGFAACNSGDSFGPLSDGAHTFEVRAIDNAGNVDPTPALYTWVIDATPPDTTITTNPTDPSGDPTPTFTFTGDDGGGTGVASFECQMDGGGFAACNSGDSFGPLSDGAHTFEVRAIDNAGNVDPTPASYTWTVNLTAPTVGNVNTVADTGDGILADYETVTVGITEFIVVFSEDVYEPAGDSDPDDVTNPDNYILVRELGDTADFQTLGCDTGVVTPADTQISISSIAYDNITFTATFTVNSGLPLSNGTYRLFICGTTSIVNVNGVPLNFNGNVGVDHSQTFIVNIPTGGNTNSGATDDDDDAGGFFGALIPVTGFTPGEVTILPVDANPAYRTSLQFEIPSLDIYTEIVGVEQSGSSWDVRSLGGNVGYLEGSAYPTWSGNTVLTGHVTDAADKPGPFARLKELESGDKVYIHLNGYMYVYQVEQNFIVAPTNVSAVFKHQPYDWLTLVTCENYNKVSETYTSRRVVRAVLISVVEYR